MKFARFMTTVAGLTLLAACSATQSSDDLANAPAGPDAGTIAQAPPPPPPPPSPPAPVAESGDTITVTATPRNQTLQEVPVTVTGVNGQQLVKRAGSPQVSPRASSQGPDATSSVPPTERVYRYFPPVFVAQPPSRDQYEGEEVSPVKLVAGEPVSTFSVDVDTGAYANARRFLTDGSAPPKASVRTEEFINYFRYDYEKPTTRDQPFAVHTDVAASPWNASTKLVRIGLAGYDLPSEERPAANLVFLLDVSGSMSSRDKLPLVKTAMRTLTNKLTADDRVSIVVYAGAAGVVLEPTSSAAEIRNALQKLRAGGSTAGGAGIELAYSLAEANRIKGGVNRVILATDGDFNVGTSNREELIELIERKRKSGTTLTVLGFGRGNLNDAMMEQIADHGNGNYAYIDSALEANKVLGDEMGATLFTIAKDVKIQVEFNPAVVSQYRLIGYENRILREEDFNNDAVDAGDIGAGHQVTALYEVVPTGAKGWIGNRRYETTPQSRAVQLSAEAAHIKLRYKAPGGDTSKLIEYTLPASALSTSRKPRGDFAFASAVAAFGQKLRGDNLMGSFAYDDIADMAGNPRDFWRQEFIQLVKAAESHNEDGAQSGG